MHWSGELSFTCLPVRSMASVIKAMHKLTTESDNSFEIYVRGRGATRKGDIVELDDGAWYRLDASRATGRKQFYAVYVGGTWVRMRPEHDLFTAVRVGFTDGRPAPDCII